MKPQWDGQVAQFEAALEIWRAIFPNLPKTFTTAQGVTAESEDLGRTLEELFGAIKLVNGLEDVDPILLGIHQAGVINYTGPIAAAIEALKANPGAANLLDQIAQNTWNIRASLVWLIPTKEAVAHLQTMGATLDAESKTAALKNLSAEYGKAVNKIIEASQGILGLVKDASEANLRIVSYERESSTAKTNVEASAAVAASSKEAIEKQLGELTAGLEQYRSLQSEVEALNAPLACADQYDKHPGTLIEQVFLPALRYLSATQDYGWIRMLWVSWLNKSIIKALDQDQAGVVLGALLRYPDLENAPEYIVASIAERWPQLVIDFLGERQAYKRTEEAAEDFDAIPFSIYELQAPLSAVPDLMLAGARQWFDVDPLHFPFNGGRLLAAVFSDLGNGLRERLVRLIADGKEEDHSFALAVLSAFEGKEAVYEHVRSIVAAADVGSPLVEEAAGVLRESGVVMGEFGFAELNARRKALLEPWLQDASEKVKAFAQAQIHSLEQRISAEVRAAEASIALRRLNYGEEIGEGDARAKEE